MNREKLMEVNARYQTKIEELNNKITELKVEPDRLKEVIKIRDVDLLNAQRVLLDIVYLEKKVLPAKEMRKMAKEVLGL